MAAVDKFVFVNYTGQPDKEARQSLPTVRQHVMHDFFRRQREAENGASEEVSAPDVSARETRPQPRRRNTRQAASQPRSKRSSIRRGSRARNTSTRQSLTDFVFHQEHPCIEEDSPSSSGHTPSLTDSSSVGFAELDFSSPTFSIEQSASSPESEESSPPSTALVQTATQAPVLSVPNPFLSSPAVHRWDPFNSMPLNGLAVDSLATWHFHRPINRNNIWESKVTWLDKVDSHFRRGLWSIALTSTPLFHILLCIAEMKKSVLTGDRNQVNYFEHKIAAMRAISEGVSRLSSLPQFSGMSQLSADERAGISEGSTDTFVMLVAIQVNLALGDREYDAAKTHMRCVHDLVTKAGGLSTFGYTQWRHTVWNDLKLASALLERPLLEYDLRFGDAKLPQEIITEAHKLSLETLRLIPTSSTLSTQTAYDLFNRLHQLSLAFDSQLTEEHHFVAFENNIYQTVFQLCNMIADGQKNTECTPTDMLILGAQLTTWMCMPSLVNMRALFNTVINTIQSKLVYRLWNGLKIDLIASWEQDAKLDSLLWVLFQACSAVISVCSTRETWMPQYMLESFMSTIKQVTLRLQISSLVEFEKCLRQFPYSDNVFGDDSKLLWKQMGLDNDMVSPTTMIVEQV